eukprot:6137334-Karenia_brevis.AAC.1
MLKGCRIQCGSLPTLAMHHQRSLMRSERWQEHAWEIKLSGRDKRNVELLLQLGMHRQHSLMKSPRVEGALRTSILEAGERSGGYCRSWTCGISTL